MAEIKYQCSCCGREAEKGRAYREVEVSIHSIGNVDYFKQDVLCDVCYKELLYTINAYCEEDV